MINCDHYVILVSCQLLIKWLSHIKEVPIVMVLLSVLVIISRYGVGHS